MMELTPQPQADAPLAQKKHWIRSALAILLLPLVVYLTDFVVRYSYITKLDAASTAIFSFSLLYEVVLYATVIWLLSFFKLQQIIVVGIFAVLLSAVQLLAYGHYFYFGVLPNHYSLKYCLDHTQDALELALSTIRWMHLVFFFCLVFLNFIIAFFSLNQLSQLRRSSTVILVVSFITVSLFFNNNVRFHPTSYSFSPSIIFTAKYVIQEQYFGSHLDMVKVNAQRRFSIKENAAPPPRYNCVLFISEGVRKSSLSYYGYSRPTAPFVDSMVRQRKIVAFRNHYANSVSTQFAVPMILSGNYTAEKLHQPFIYDYVKKWTGTTTFFFSSQSMAISNLDLVYNTLVDSFVCRENSQRRRFNDLGFDDKEMLEVVGNFLLHNKRQKFFGVIQLNNTHYPYRSDAAFRRYQPDTPNSLNAYDNSVEEQDFIIRKCFELMEQHQLLDSTIFIFTSDHGEAFDEHRHSGHLNTLYNEDVAVPLWAYLPPNFPKEKRETLARNSQLNTSHLDIFPTLLELYSCLDTTKLNTKPLGKSLFSTFDESRTIPLLGMDMLDNKAVVIGSWKYILTMKDAVAISELYNLSNDPHETINLWEHIDNVAKENFSRRFQEAEKHRKSFDTLR